MKKIVLVLLYLFIFNSSAIALVEVDITRGNLNPLPIAVSPLYIEPGSNEIKQDGKNTFVITPKGQLFLEKYKKFLSIAESFGLEM